MRPGDPLVDGRWQRNPFTGLWTRPSDARHRTMLQAYSELTGGGRAAATGGGGGGTVDTLTTIYRSSGSAAGGLVNFLAVTNIVGTPPVTVGGVPATGVVVFSPTIIQYTTPGGLASAPGGLNLDVVCGGQTLAGAFSSNPLRSADIAKSDFEDGTFGVFQAPFGDASVISSLGHSGTHCVQHTYQSSGSSNQFLEYDFGFTNPATTEVNGIYCRFFVRIPAATQAALVNGQIKVHRMPIYDPLDNKIGGWYVFGTGPEIAVGAASPSTTLRAEGDDTPANVGITGDLVILPDTWYETIFWYKRNSALGTGTSRLWFGTPSGALALIGSQTNAGLGTDGATDHTKFITGDYSQNLGGGGYPVITYTDDVTIARGGWFSEP